MTQLDVLVDGLRCAPGPEFFRWLVTWLREVLDVRYAFVGEFTGDDASRLRVLATSEDTAQIDHHPYEYELAGTAAAEPRDADGFNWYPAGVRARFPGVQIYNSLGIESIACLHLADGHGRPLGMLSVLDTRAFADPARVRETLLALRARTTGDLELHRGQQERRLLTETAVAGREIERLRSTRVPDERATSPVTGAAHDFNNLLAGIVAHSDLALGELPAPSPVRTRLEAIQLTARRAADLARDMLDGQTGEHAADEPVPLGALARETVLLLGPAIPAHVRVGFDEEDGVPAVPGNPSQLRQIVMNLLLNAAEAIGEHTGHIDVSVHLDRASAAFGLKRRVVLTVADTGVGMTAAARARIFESAFTTKARGRGIGLAVVRRLVERHGATIAVDSTLGVGTRFVLSFPTDVTDAEPAPMRRDPIPALPLGARRSRALLVDDDEGVRVTTAHMLRRLGCDVIDAADGAAAIAAAEVNAGSLDFVLLDLTMPGLSGEDVVHMVQRRWPTLPIVVMSGYLSSDVERRLAQAMPLRFLQKPFGLDALRRCLAALNAPSAPPTAAAV